MRNFVIKLSLIVALCLSFTSIASAAGIWQKGQHYTELPLPVKTNDPSKIEVVEVFWYGCPHCYEFANDHLPAWEANLADDVDFVLMHATFPNWLGHAKAYFAAEALGVVDKLHKPLFDAIQANSRKYADQDDYRDLFIKHGGVSAEEYDAVFKASGFRKISQVDAAIKKASERIKAYRVTGVPALIVNGKYFIGVGSAGGYANMLKVANYLIDQERQILEKKAK